MRAVRLRLRVTGLRTATTACAALTAVVLTATAAQALATSGFASTPLNCAEANGRVGEIKVMGAAAYLGGSFTQVTAPDGTTFPRSGAAAIDTTTCAVLPWNPSVTGSVLALEPTASAVYIGGDFTRVGTSPRTNLAAVDPATGGVTSFAPVVKGQVTELAASSTKLYAVGGINSVNGSPRSKAAAFSLSTGALDAAWAPVANARIDGMDVSSDGTRVYLGGSFDTINGSTNGRFLSAVNAATGALDPGFVPGIRVPATEVLAVGDQVAVAYGGPGGQGALLTRTGSVVVSGRADGNFQAVAVSGDEIVAGGHFGSFCPSGSACTVRRAKAFSLRISTRELSTFDPEFDSALGVWAMAYDPATGRLFTGGDFTRAGSHSVNHLAVFGS